MIILGIETSCDDTGVALLKAEKGKFEILSNIVFSQAKLHTKYGGVYPSLAKREHQKNLPIVFKKVLKEAGIQRFDLIAVTVGPGLEPCLWQGINFAVDLAKKSKRPIIPVNHIEAHILVNFVGKKFQILRLRQGFGGQARLRQGSGGQANSKLFPAICLVVSGGHTELILMEGIGKYKMIGKTRDDAAGECFDKTARLLGLGYPGGPAIAKIANQHESNSRIFANKKLAKISEIKLPRPMIYQKNYDFSFAGLKTAVLYNFQSRPLKERKSKRYVQAMAFEIQQAIIDVLIKKTLKAAKEFKARSIILGGGVACNEELRKQFNLQLTTNNLQLNFFVPPKKFCTDNGAMIAVCGYFHRKEALRDWKKITPCAKLKINEGFN